MKAGLFGGGWEDYITPVDDYFDDAIRNVGSRSPYGFGADAIPPMMTDGMDDGRDAPVGEGAGWSPIPPTEFAVTAITPNTSPATDLAQNTTERPGTVANAAFDAAAPSNETPIGAAAPAASADPGETSVLNPYSRLDYGVISKHEGPRSIPYIPGDGKTNMPSANSGVTVATGVDLSEHTAAELRDWGVSEDTIARLTPFLKPDGASGVGLKGGAAAARLSRFKAENPTSEGLPVYAIPMSDALAMDNGALRNIERLVRQAYNATGTAVPFEHLPRSIQTAIVDVAYQNGPDLARGAPAFWRDVTSGGWSAAADELHNWTKAQKADPNATRTLRQRDDEKLIRGGINGVARKQ